MTQLQLILQFLVWMGAVSLPMPSQLMVEHLTEPTMLGGMLTVSTLRPRFSFLPHAQHEHPGSGVSMTAYRIVVSSAGSVSWDSGVVNASAVVAVLPGVDLAPRTTYTWTAQWFAKGELSPSPVAAGSFDIGPGETDADWPGTEWVGEGQTEFRLEFAAGAADRLYVASPGGSVVFVNGRAVTDECGVSAWINFDANLPYIGVNLTSAVAATQDRQAQTGAVVVLVKVGSGFYGASRWRAQGKAKHSAARLLLVDARGAPVGTGAGGAGGGGGAVALTGRAGAAVSADPFVGGIFNLGLDPGEGWGPVRPVPDLQAANLAGPLRAFALPPARTAPGAAAALRSSVVSVFPLPPAPAPVRCALGCDLAKPASQNKTLCHGQPPEEGGCDPVTAPQRRWHYAFDRNIVGMAEVQPGSFRLNCEGTSGCKGNVTVQ